MEANIQIVESIAPKRISPRSRQHQPAVREHCEALYKSGWMPAQISTQTGVPKGTITQWAKRYLWTDSRDKIGQILQKGVMATIGEKLAQRSEAVQDALASDLVEQAEVLRDNPPRSVGDLTKGRTATVKALVDASDKLFGWSSQKGSGCIIPLGYLALLETAPTPPKVLVEVEPATQAIGLTVTTRV